MKAVNYSQEYKCSHLASSEFFSGVMWREAAAVAEIEPREEPGICCCTMPTRAPRASF